MAQNETIMARVVKFYYNSLIKPVINAFLSLVNIFAMFYIHHIDENIFFISIIQCIPFSYRHCFRWLKGSAFILRRLKFRNYILSLHYFLKIKDSLKSDDRNRVE